MINMSARVLVVAHFPLSQLYREIRWKVNNDFRDCDDADEFTEWPAINSRLLAERDT